MSKAIVRIDIPDDYADEYKEWLLEGRLCYLEDDAWLHLKDVQCKVEPYYDLEEINNAPTVEAIPKEWIKAQLEKEEYRAFLVDYIEWGNCLRWLLEAWEKENEANVKC